MNNASHRALIFSLILHTVFFSVLIGSFLWNNYNDKKVVKHVFKLQQCPKEVESKKIVAKVENKIINELKESSKLNQNKENTIEKKVENKMEDSVKKAVVKTEIISYSDFIKKQKPSNNTKNVKKVKEVKEVAKNIEVPKISRKSGKDLQQKLSSLTTMTANELIDYETYLYAMIDGAWECPKNFEGYKNGALFVFEVDASGRIVKVKMAQTSGSQIFDESVQQAFKKIAIVKPNPCGRASEFQLMFSKK